MNIMEKRKHIRFHVDEASPLANIKVHYPEKIIEARLYDISYGGIAFISSEALNLSSGTIVFLPFPACDCNEICDILKIKGQIRWSRCVDGTNLVMHGLEFDEESREMSKGRLLTILSCFSPSAKN